jgi:hypothetical protein
MTSNTSTSRRPRIALVSVRNRERVRLPRELLDLAHPIGVRHGDRVMLSARGGTVVHAVIEIDVDGCPVAVTAWPLDPDARRVSVRHMEPLARIA